MVEGVVCWPGGIAAGAASLNRPARGGAPCGATKCVGVVAALRPKNWPTRRVARAEKWQTSEDWRGRQRESRTRNRKQTRRDDDGLTRHCDGGYLPDEGSRNDGGKLSLPHAAEARSWGLLPSALQCVRSGLGAWWSTETLDRPTSPAPQLPDLPAHDWAHATGRRNIINTDRRG